MDRKFPFRIRHIAKILNLKIRYDNQDNGNLDVDCPFCKKQSKMNLNAAKNAYRCNNCGESGGMIPLYGKIYGISNSDAYREICEILGCSGKISFADNNTLAPLSTIRADGDTINQTYSMLLSLLNLANPHREHLLARGLSQEQITEFKYKSVPAFGQRQLCIKLLQSGCTLDGVPGFFKENGDWNVKLKAPGIVIPVCGIDGRITGMQIRLNTPVNGKKYIWVSSKDLDGGTSSGAPIHFIGDPTAKQVYATDGSLRGAIAHTLTGKSFICLPGVNGLNGLDEVLVALKTNGTTTIIEALDIKKLNDKHISESAAKLRDKLFAHGFKVTSAVWGNISLEGVDDYFMHRMNEKKNHVYDVDINAAVAV
jgi:hypothetical protein